MSSTVISVTWDHLRACRADSDPSVSFKVLHSVVSGGVAHNMELVTVATEAILVGLTPYSNYSVKVAIIVDESGDMGPSAVTPPLYKLLKMVILTCVKINFLYLNSYSSRCSRWNHSDSICVSSEPDMGATTDA